MKYVILFLLLAMNYQAFAVEAKVGTSKKLPAENSEDIFVCNTGDTVLKTYAAAIRAFNHLLPGQGVYLCRGGEFEVTRSSIISRAACEADKVCTFGAYGEGEAPIVRSNGGVLTLEAAEDGSIKYVDIKNIRFIGPGYVEAVVTGVKVSEKAIIENVNFINIVVEGFHTGMYHKDGNNNQSINVYNSRFSHNKGAGFLGGSNNSVLENNVFEHSGTGKGGHQIYVAGNGLKNLTVRGNTLRYNAPVGGVCNRGPLVAHGIIDGLLIEDNVILEDKENTDGGCWGIAVDQGRAWPESFENVIIRGNTVKYAGNMPIGCSNCPGAIIEDNIITIEGRISSGIMIPTKTERDGAPTVAPIVRNNIITVESPISTRDKRWGIRVVAPDAEVYDNTIYYEDVSRFFHCAEVNGVDIDGNNCVTN